MSLLSASSPLSSTSSDDRRSRSSAPTLAAAFLGFFVITLDATIVNVALPSIRNDLGGGITGLQWVVDGYTLMFAALLLSSGALSDRVGARRAFATGLVMFAVASVACGLAPTMGVLVAARFLQGTGAAVMMPSSMALIRQAYADPITRARAIGIWALGGSAAAISGPVLGGILSLVSWRLIFFINVPVIAVILLLLSRTLRSAHHKAPFDWVGQITAILAMGGLTYGAIEAGAHGFAAPRVMIALGTAVVALAAFVISQARAAHPMVPLDLFRSRNVVIANAVGFAFMVGFYGVPFLFSLYYQEVRGMSSLQAGLAFLPMMVIGASLTPLSARIVERVGPRVPIVGGLCLMTAGAAALSATPESTEIWVLAVLMIPIGLGGPLIAPPVTAVLLYSVPGRLAGTASGVFNTSRQMGGALAIAVFGALLANPGAFTEGLRMSLVIAAAVAFAAAVGSLFLNRK